MNWLLITTQWYLMLFVIGIIFTPLTKKLFKKFSFDLGYPFAKTLGILLLSYFIFILGIFKVLPFSRINLIFALCLFAIINLYVLFRSEKLKILRSTIFLYIFEEVLFIGCLFLWTFVRGQEPSIHSLEKFMDFGFMNSILRSKFFPPKDIWYTPEPINYYYFGHLTGAILIKLSNIKATIGYNLILATIFAQSITSVFSLVVNIIKRFDQKISHLKVVVFGIIGAYMVNLGGNLHTIYVFTKGYPNDNPLPFWQILSGFNPASYWYPNATRFIPYTIHEFPSYSYVVADLHGHVFDIPFVIMTLAFLFIVITSPIFIKTAKNKQNLRPKAKNFWLMVRSNLYEFKLAPPIFLGFMTAVHYMTNAFDGPIYILLSMIIFLFMLGFSSEFFMNMIVLLASFVIFALPFSWYFKPFVSGIGVNCSPKFLTDIGRIGPFLFEAEKCQISPFWMLFVLWGFFWVSFLIFIFIIFKRYIQKQVPLVKIPREILYIFILFAFSIFLTIIPEFFYIKDIYPQHFRANTMFKLGYQAFTMMGIASILTFYLLKNIKKTLTYFIVSLIFIFFLFFPSIYPYFSVPSYYGLLNRQVQLDGQVWLKQTYPADNEIINYLNSHEKGQPVILEAQGDSYTDYERISAFTGLPTVAGWWVHEWLWRGSSDVIGNRIPEVVTLYESKDITRTKFLIKKYHIKYVIVSQLERQKYPNLDEQKWSKIGRLIFKSSDGFGALYQLNK